MRRLDPELQPLFWRQLASLLGGGLPLSDALLALGRDADSRALRETTDAVRARVDDGESLPDAVAAVGGFDDTTVASLRAAEASGRLVEMCRIVADHGERSRGVRLRARMVLAYPVVLWVVGALISSGLYAVTHEAYESYARLGSLAGGSPYGWMFALAVAANAALAVLAVLAMLATWVWRGPRPGGWRRRLERLVLRVPLWSRYWRAVVLGRFLGGLATLLRAGVPLDRALELAGASSGSVLVAADADRAAAAVRDGAPAAGALGSETVMSPAVLWTLRTADERGDLVESVAELASLYDETAEIGGATALTVLEPAAIVIAGCLAAFLVLSTVLPTYDLYSLVP